MAIANNGEDHLQLTTMKECSDEKWWDRTYVLWLVTLHKMGGKGAQTG